MPELPCGGDDELYVGGEDHQLYKLVGTGTAEIPRLAWADDNEDMTLALHGPSIRSPLAVTTASCTAVSDGTVHRIVIDDGEPVTGWAFDNHTDNVRELRLQYEALDTWPEL